MLDDESRESSKNAGLPTQYGVSPAKGDDGTMVIDKTTGKGCALSIVSKAVTRKLIAEGIVGKAIYRKPHTKSKTGYVLLRVVDFQHEEGVYILLPRRKIGKVRMKEKPSNP